MYRDSGRKGHIAMCERCENELVVRESQSYSPADMARLHERGMPVNSVNTAQAIIEGEENPSFDISSDRKRHVDVCDLWEEHMQIRDKARKAAQARKMKSKQSKTTAS